jgi:Family of unknown function (DUF6009)
MLATYDPALEANVIWVDRSPAVLKRYAREMIVPCSQRANRPRLSRHIIAYATLRPEAQSETPGRFMRRVWYISDHNIDGNPLQAVDPNAIAAGNWTPRWKAKDAGDVYIPI